MERLEVRWRLVVRDERPDDLARALAPESKGHHEMRVEDGALVASGAGSPGETLHTVDDLLACLSAALAVRER